MNTREVFDSIRDLLFPVPSESLSNVCYLCLGATNGDYEQCADCWKLFRGDNPCPASLRRRVVPMSIALNPSTWYGMLRKYKKAEFREHAHVLASFAYEWLKRHRNDVYELLGGRADIVTIVPSKRGYSYDTQPLRRALAMEPTFASRLSETLRCVQRDAYDRMRYASEVFRAINPGAIRGRRIMLIEDTWISGATAIDAAGALLDAGAERVVVLPIAREVDESFRGPDHPYVKRIKRSRYDLDAWPRERE